MRFLLLCAGLFLSAQLCLAQPNTLTVSAAASLKPVLSSLGTDFQKSHSNTKINFNFAGSGTLRAQIEAGAPVDLFIPADDANMNALARQNLVEAASRRVLAGNRLVLVVPLDSRLGIQSFRDLKRTDIARVAIGAPGVPAGDRAREVLARLGIRSQIEAKAVRGKDVRETLAQVETGNVDAGVVYRTDAQNSSRVKIVAMAPQGLHKPIRYPVALVQGAANRSLALRFLTFLGSSGARKKLKAAGFVVR